MNITAAVTNHNCLKSQGNPLKRGTPFNFKGEQSIGDTLNNLYNMVTKGKSMISSPLLSTSLNSNEYVGFLDKRQLDRFTWLATWTLGVDRADYMLLSRRISHTWTYSGPTFLCKYLKECVVSLQHYVSGNPRLVIEGFPLSLTNGIPSIIPGALRLKIKAGDPKVIRGVLSILSVYRIIKCKSDIKLKTITAPFSGISETLLFSEISPVIRLLPKLPKKDLNLASYNLILSSKAGPNHSNSSLGASLDAYALSKTFEVLPKLLEFLILVKNEKLLSLLSRELEWVTSHDSVIFDRPPILGKLSTKIEAAGKVRVFAIVDVWTQTAFKGLHKFVFKILRRIPQDGTFDQSKPLELLLASIRSGLCSAGVNSFDLSAATDRFPIGFQKQVLALLFNNERFAVLWADLLTKRDYYFDDRKFPGERGVYRYAVGQPMGALSSWAMLALSHHIIVQIAAQRVGWTQWFPNYALLGDDLVIADELVSKSYLDLMSKTLGVEINLSKSLKSDKGVLEFAKRLTSPSTEFSPLGAKNVLLSMRDKNGIPSLFLDLYNKGFSFDSETVISRFKKLRIRDESFKKNLYWTIVGPFGFIVTAGGLAESLTLTNSLNTVRLNILLTSIDDELHNNHLSRWRSELQRSYVSLANWERSVVPGFGLSDLGWSPSHEYYHEQAIDQFYTLIRSKPVRRYVYDAPLGFGVYMPNFKEEIVKYIQERVRGVTTSTLSVFNPFLPDLAIPNRKRPNRNFFRRVETNMNDRVKGIMIPHGLWY